MAKESAREKWARETGRPKSEYPGSSAGSSSGGGGAAKSGYSAIGDTGKNISGDAQKAMNKLSSEAQQYILSQDFGGELSSSEVKKLNSKWIDAGKTNSSTVQDLAVSNLPDEAFNITTPQLIPGTPEYQAASDKLSTAYFDILQQQVNASTDQEKAAADYNWKTLKSGIEKTLGINLSNDAYQAWNQMQTIKSQAGQNNITNSGIQNESMDDYLASIRRSDSVARDEANTKEEAGQQDYYTKFATPDQIKALIASDPEKAKAWGLLPSDEIRNSLTVANLKAKYPNMSDEDIQRSISSVLDANGNYRSSLYQKYMTGSNLGANMGTLGTAVKDENGNVIAQTVNPSDTGFLDIEQAKSQYKDLNTPLANLLESYNEGVALGSIKPTTGADSATSAGTQFNKIVTPTTTDKTVPVESLTPVEPVVDTGKLLPGIS
ncbi:MAG: hypothetical protein WC917_02810 [Bacilli bacterium]|jgi:hypothetical protein